MKDNKKEQEMIREYLEQQKRMLNENLSVRDNMILVYAAHFPDVSREEAGEIVKKLLNGIHDFDEKISVYSQNGVQAFLEDLDRTLEAKSKEERYAAYCNMIVAIKSMEEKALNRILSSNQEEREAIFHDIAETAVDCDSLITDEMLTEARSQLEEALENSTISFNDIDRLRRLQEGEVEAYVHQFAVDNWSYEERKAYLSLAAYMAYQDGVIQTKHDVDPYYWAAGVAANIEAGRVIHEAWTGELSWEMANIILKGIGFILLSLSMAYIWARMFIVFLEVLAACTSFCGSVLIGTVGLWVMAGMLALTPVIMELCMEGYDSAEAYVKEKMPLVKESIQKAYRFIRDKVAAGSIRLKRGLEAVTASPHVSSRL